MESNFSMVGGVMGGRDSSGNVTSGEQKKLPLLACCSPVAHLLLCDLGVGCVGKEAGDHCFIKLR